MTVDSPTPPFAAALAALGFDADAVLERARALVALRVRRTVLTPLWCLVVAPEGVAIRPKADVIGELLAAGLDDPARLLLAAKPKAAELMAWVSGEADCAVFKLSVPSTAQGGSMTFERSHGKARPTLPRASDLSPVDPEATDADRRRNHGPDGRVLPGNDLARGKGWKGAIKKLLGREATDAEAIAVGEDAWKIFCADLREMPHQGSMVRGLLTRKARHDALGAFWEAKAIGAGLDTPDGQKAQEWAMKHGQRAERLAVTALDIAQSLAGKRATSEGIDAIRSRILGGAK